MSTPENEVELAKLQIELARVKEQGRNERQKNLINMVLGLASTGLGLWNAVQISANHADTVAKVKQVYDETPSARAVAEVSEKVDANLLQWKAYKTKDPGDEAKAEVSLGKAVADMP